MAQLSKKERVAILVDEYDKPIIDNLDNQQIALANRKTLRVFYETIKESDRYLKFVFITGVSKFSRVSVFSGLNNLIDITISGKFATITGYTQQEFQHYFTPRLELLAGKFNQEKSALSKEIKDWYNGYSWDGIHFVYNPHSILTFFLEERIDNYWFTSGTPSFLIQMVKESSIDVPGLENYRTGKSLFESFDIENMNIYSLLFQTGYLTVKSIDGTPGKRGLYTLSYPNLEVKESFLEHLLGAFSGRFANEVSVIAS